MIDQKLPLPTQILRVRGLRISAPNLISLLQALDGTKRVRCRGIPVDARAVAIIYDPVGRPPLDVGIVIESATYPEMQEGTALQWISAEFELVPDS